MAKIKFGSFSKSLNKSLAFMLILSFWTVSFAQTSPILSPLRVSNCVELSREQSIIPTSKCDILISSMYLNSDSVYVKAWIPKQVKSQTPVILFLHGLGNCVSPESTHHSMIEANGLSVFLKSPQYAAHPTIVLAPQDLFVDQDNKRGRDYWLGNQGRDWESFFTRELIPNMQQRYDLGQHRWLTAGISMGAHGAMKLALDHPDHFKAFAAISPVFRSTTQEISNQSFFIETVSDPEPFSIGVRMLHDVSSVTQPLRTVRHWITIHENDFSLNPNNFPMNQGYWQQLMNFSSTSQDKVEVSPYPLGSAGHAGDFWQQQLPSAMIWLINLDIEEFSI